MRLGAYIRRAFRMVVSLSAGAVVETSSMERRPKLSVSVSTGAAVETSRVGRSPKVTVIMWVYRSFSRAFGKSFS